MKSFLLLASFSCALLLMQSCGYCTRCVQYPKESVKLCKKDFASDESYNQAFRQLTYEGYDCQ